MVGSIIYNLALRHTFSVQLPSVRHASSKAVVSRKSMCAYRLTVRSITQHRKVNNIEIAKLPGYTLTKLCKSCGRGKFVKNLKVLPRKVFQNRQAGH